MCDISNDYIFTVNKTKLEDEIMKVNDDIKKLFEEQNVDALAKHYTDDCKLILLPDKPTISGRDGEQPHTTTVFINIIMAVLSMQVYRCC